MSVSNCCPGLQYGDEGIHAYAKFAHGPDVRMIYPYILPNLQGQKRIFDSGCGACPFSIYAAETGATVDAVDLQPGMIKEAIEAIEKAGLTDAIHPIVGDATQTSYLDNTFDHSISVNVGCNLPSSIFPKYFTEIGRVLKKDGSADVVVPDSLDVVFTDDSVDDSCALEHIYEVLDALPNNPELSVIQSKFDELKEILSATFTLENERVVLVTKNTTLKSAQIIWRKLPSITIPNHYHSPKEYAEVFAAANLNVVSVDKCQFLSEKQRLDYNDRMKAKLEKPYKLGKTYLNASAFAVYHLKK